LIESQALRPDPLPRPDATWEDILTQRLTFDGDAGNAAMRLPLDYRLQRDAASA
jgi:hypothetical protein